MCGRYTNEMTWAEIHALYSIHDAPPARTNQQPRYNIAPTQDVVGSGNDLVPSVGSAAVIHDGEVWQFGRSKRRSLFRSRSGGLQPKVYAPTLAGWAAHLVREMQFATIRQEIMMRPYALNEPGNVDLLAVATVCMAAHGKE